MGCCVLSQSAPFTAPMASSQPRSHASSYSLLFSSLLNATQAMTASWRRWASSEFDFPLKSCLITGVSEIRHLRVVCLFLKSVKTWCSSGSLAGPPRQPNLAKQLDRLDFSWGWSISTPVWRLEASRCYLPTPPLVKNSDLLWALYLAAGSVNLFSAANDHHSVSSLFPTAGVQR